MKLRHSWEPARAMAIKALRPVLRKGWWHWIRFALLLAAGSWLGHVLSESPRFTDIRYALYQKQVRWQHRGALYPQHTVLVMLNDQDYWSPAYAGRAPIHRDALARLLLQLDAGGAYVIGVDFNLVVPHLNQPDYDYPEFRAEDLHLKAALHKLCSDGRHVVLTSYLVGDDLPKVEPTIYAPWLPELPCVTVGHDSFPSDLRIIAGMMQTDKGTYMDSFSLALVKLVDPVAYASLASDKPNEGHGKGYRYGEFLTPEDFAPKDGKRYIYNGTAVEAMSPEQLRQAIGDRIVLVGGQWSSVADGLGDPVDTYNSPGGLESGLMLHANSVEAELNQQNTFTAIPDSVAELIEYLLAFGLAVVASLNVPPLWKWGSVAVSMVFSLLLTYVLMQNLGLFLDFFIPLLMVLVHTITEELMEMQQELKHARHALRQLQKLHAEHEAHAAHAAQDAQPEPTGL